MLLEMRGVVAGYGNKTVLEGVSLHVDAGEVVTLVGHNGAGKSTVLKTVMGVQRAREGSITYRGKDITSRPTAMNVRDGICYVPQERAIFRDLSVLENLEVAGTALNRGDHAERLSAVFLMFPVLEKRQAQRAGSMSGGEQQALALGISLMLKPSLLLLDEPSLGLSPALALQVFEKIRHINKTLGMAILLVEHRVIEALAVTDRAYAMRAGKVERESKPEALLADKKFWELF